MTPVLFLLQLPSAFVCSPAPIPQWAVMKFIHSENIRFWWKKGQKETKNNNMASWILPLNGNIHIIFGRTRMFMQVMTCTAALDVTFHRCVNPVLQRMKHPLFWWALKRNSHGQAVAPSSGMDFVFCPQRAWQRLRSEEALGWGNMPWSDSCSVQKVWWPLPSKLSRQ